MVAFTKFLWLALTATAATAAAIVQRDVVTVQNDIAQKISPTWATLHTDINAFPDSGVSGAVTIRLDFTNAIAALNATTADIKNTVSFGVVSGTAILADVQQLVPTFVAAIVKLGTQVSSWIAIPDGKALILSQLRSADAAVIGFLDAVIAAEPQLLKAGGLAIKAQMTATFTTAIAAYSV
ncbi:uncharacterized protein Triagg1_7578 [Trichoderma aggressivum f. europaeum]|uniref:Antigenic cell wall galactomannoprotein n=1 Tax=Trichoderma aggressivum f. europaeum TaxID=173218 RepID=A0AAE1IB24_9HYPO|nr:hypothetical protein Triagg1_7578 [Trichoderma aggressivum f. europaeum]